MVVVVVVAVEKEKQLLSDAARSPWVSSSLHLVRRQRRMSTYVFRREQPARL